MHEPHCPLRNARYEIGLFPEIRRVDHREPFSVSRTSSLWMDSLVSGLKTCPRVAFCATGAAFSRQLQGQLAQPWQLMVPAFSKRVVRSVADVSGMNHTVPPKKRTVNVV